jgi:transposase
MKRRAYPSDLSDEEWQRLEPMIPVHTGIGRPVKWSRRELVNAMLYVLRSGCQWRMLPHEYPPYGTVFYHFRQWRRTGLWERINQALREQVRVEAGREAQPSAGVVDSQSVKTTEKGANVAMMEPRR